MRNRPAVIAPAVVAGVVAVLVLLLATSTTAAGPRSATAPTKKPHPTQTTASPTPTPTATVTPTPTVTATVTPTPTATATAPVTGYPDASNTGVPAGTTLTAYTGPLNITTDGTVIDGKTLGCIEVDAAKVIIRNSKIICAGNPLLLTDDNTASAADGSEHLLIEDTEIDCRNTNSSGVGEANLTARRVNIHGCENGLSINQNVTVEDSYIHDIFNGNGAHADGAQLSYGYWDGSAYNTSSARNVIFRHNTIFSIDAAGALGNSAIQSNPNGDTNILLENNLFGGGGYTVYCDYQGTATNYRVINNHFTTRFSPNVGAFGPSLGCADESVVSGNVYHESGQPVPLD